MLLSANCFAELTMGAVMLANKKYPLLFYFEFFALLLVLLTQMSRLTRAIKFPLAFSDLPLIGRTEDFLPLMRINPSMRQISQNIFFKSLELG